MSHEELPNYIITLSNIQTSTDEEKEAVQKALEAIKKIPEYKKLRSRDTAHDIVIEDNKTYCPECNTKIRPTDNFCFVCGQRLIYKITEKTENETEGESAE